MKKEKDNPDNLLFEEKVEARTRQYAQQKEVVEVYGELREYTRFRLGEGWYLIDMDFVITFHGGIKQHDGLHLLLEAVRSIKERIPIKVIIIGSGSVCNALQTLSEKYNIQDNIIFTGTLNHEDIPAYLSISSAGIIARLLWQGDIAASMMECMSSGIPLICADLDGIEQHFTDRKNILLFKTGSSADLGRRIEQMYTDKDLYRTIRENSREAVTKYDRRKSAEILYNDMKKFITEKNT